MKEKIGLIMITAIVFCSAQLKAQDDLKTKISIGYGSITVPAIKDISITQGVVNSFFNQQTSTSSTGALGIQFDRDLTGRFSVGAGLVYQGVKKDITGTNYNENQKYSYYTVLANGTFSYVHKPGFDFYGRFGLGVSFRRATSTIVNQGQTSTANANKSDVAYQISPIGIRAGKKLFFKTEVGYGYMGVFSIGVGYRF